MIPQHRERSTALRLCIVGLLGVFAVGYPGYFVFDAVWPSFYYSPIPVGKNAWLLAQAFFIAVHFAGTPDGVQRGAARVQCHSGGWLYLDLYFPD
jgi:hypothetical protein